MTSEHRTALITGALLIAATVTSLLATGLLPPLSGSTSLANLAAHSGHVEGAALLMLIQVATSAAIAVTLYPVLRKWNEGFALGAVIFRSIEAVFYTFNLVALLSILTLSQRLAGAPGVTQASLRSAADTLVAARQHSSLAAVFAFGIGGSLYYVVLYGSRLVPRWLAGWGVAGALLTIAASLLALLRGGQVTGYWPIILPLALQEMVLAVWLLVKGFDQQAVNARATASSAG